MPETVDAFKPRRIKCLGLALGITLVAMVGFVPAAGAAVIPVNTTLDEFNSGANCSLREAVEAANTNAIFSGCPAGQAGAFDPDTINVPAGTYTLTQNGVGANNIGDLDVTDTNLTIQNTGGGQTTIDEASPTGDRVIEIAGSVSGASIIGIRITGGATTLSGGGIANSSTSLLLTNVTLDGNSAGGGGGGIFTGAGTVLSLNNVTVSGNSAGAGDGGGVLYDSDSVSPSFFKNSTIVNNDAENGGGIRNDGTGIVNISNTILTDNVGGGEPGDCSGTVNSGNNNMVGTNVGCTFTPFAGGADLVGAEQAEIPANLGALANNGGTVLTRLPLRTSPAINRGYPGTGGGTTCESTDARGTARPQEGRCDIGAAEVLPPGPQTYAATTTGDEFDGVFAGTSCSLREAVTAANNNQATGGCPAGAAGGTATDTIQLAPGTYTLTRPGVDDTNINGDLDLFEGINIAGTGAGQTTIDGNGAVTGDRVIHVNPPLMFLLNDAISGVNIRNGVTTGNGGGIEVAAALDLTSVTVSGNFAGGDGGGVHYTSSVAGGVLNSTISGNQANANGGGMASADGFYPEVDNVTVTQNTADANASGGQGGGGLAGFAGGRIANTIVAGNTDASGGDAPDCVGIPSMPSLGHNLIGNANNCTFLAATGDQVGTSAAPIPAGLGGLANNGGRTLTHAPVFGSLALNTGSPAAPGSGSSACLTTDQLGTVRPLAGRCDVGAVEINPSAPVVTPPPVVTPGETGQRAAALKKCKKKKTARAKKKCKKKAKTLPL